MTLMTRLRLPITSFAERIRRAERARKETARVCARSAALIAWAASTGRDIVQGCEELAAARCERHREKAFLRRSQTISLPLTPRMILEIAREFRMMAQQAATPEVTRAFHSLASRYTAMAGGFDTDAMSSRTVH